MPRKAQDNKSVDMHLRLSPALYDYVERRAEAAGMQRAEFIRTLISLPIVLDARPLAEAPTVSKMLREMPPHVDPTVREPSPQGPLSDAESTFERPCDPSRERFEPLPATLDGAGASASRDVEDAFSDCFADSSEAPYGTVSEYAEDASNGVADRFSNPVAGPFAPSDASPDGLVDALPQASPEEKSAVLEGAADAAKARSKPSAKSSPSPDSAMRDELIRAVEAAAREHAVPCRHPEQPPRDPSRPLFARLDGMLAAPSDAALEAYNDEPVYTEIDGVNPVWITPEEALKEDCDLALTASFVLGEGGRTVPFGVLEKRTGALFASRVMPPVTILTDAKLGALQQSLERCNNLQLAALDGIAVVANRLLEAAWSLNGVEADVLSDLIMDVTRDVDQAQAFLLDAAELARVIIDTPRVSVVDEGRDRSKKRRRMPRLDA